MASQLDSYVEKQVSVVTTDGKYYAGILKGFDQAVNIFLSNAILTAWSPLREDINIENIVIRGDTVVMIALANSQLLPDEAPPIKSII